jgi:Uma2 family endonuclease
MISNTQLSPPVTNKIPTHPIWQLTVEQYHTMISTEILMDGDPVELLEGWLVMKMLKNRPHSFTTQMLREVLVAMLPLGWFVNGQEPITTEDSEPEPDLPIVRGERRMYSDRHPRPEDLGLVIEVADSSVERDRTIKKRIYARAGISVYWIVNLPERQIEVYSQPDNSSERSDYLQCQIFNAITEVPIYLHGEIVGGLKGQDIFS